MSAPKFIVSERQIISAVKCAIEQNIQAEKIVDVLMHDISDEIETVLYDDCEEYKAESENKGMSEISEVEIKAMSKEQNYLRGYSDGKSDTLDKLRAEIEQIEINGHIRDVECFEAGINTALNVINKYVAESEGE